MRIQGAVGLALLLAACSKEEASRPAAAPTTEAPREATKPAAAQPPVAPAPAPAPAPEAAPAPAPATPTGPESVKGKVRRSDRKQPIAGAQVHLLKYEAGGGNFGVAGGRPVPAGQAQAFNDVNAGRTEKQVGAATSGADGSYSIHGIEPGTYVVVAAAEFEEKETPCRTLGGMMFMSRNPEKQLVVALEGKSGVKVVAVSDAIKLAEKPIEVSLDLTCE